MNSVRFLLPVVLLATISSAALAVVSVDSVNYPVWMERDSQSVPLMPGDRLLVGDVVRTGASGRVWLAIDDGSVVKLGQDARFTVERAAFRDEGENSVLDAAFNLLQGAFRFTSGFFKAQRPARHEVDIQVGAITAGVRGTDIWGRSAQDEDFVALLEGRIEMTAAGQPPVPMNQPLTLYRKAKGKVADPVASVDLAVVGELAVETELDQSRGIASTGGNYALVLKSLSNDANVEASLMRFRDVGYAVQARAVDVDGKHYTRIQLEGLVHKAAAENLRRAMIDAGLIEDAWISLAW